MNIFLKLERDNIEIFCVPFQSEIFLFYKNMIFTKTRNIILSLLFLTLTGFLLLNYFKNWIPLFNSGELPYFWVTAFVFLIFITAFSIYDKRPQACLIYICLISEGFKDILERWIHQGTYASMESYGLIVDGNKEKDGYRILETATKLKQLYEELDLEDVRRAVFSIANPYAFEKLKIWMGKK